VVVDLTNDANLHDSNVVDLTRDNSSDSSFDTNPVIVVIVVHFITTIRKMV